MGGNLLHIGTGLVLLVGGAQLLVRGASKLAVALGIPPLVVGLTIVAFGTSAPELAVSIQSCLAGKTGLVLGNVVGSNIYNVLFILGLCAVIAPLGVAPQLTRFDVPVMILASAAVLICGWTGHISRWEGALLFLGIVIYTVYVVRQSLREPQDAPAEPSPPAGVPGRPWWFHVLFLLAGLGLLGFGSDLLVGGAVAIAERLGVSPALIGMTVVTLGTTAPELSACLVAAFRGERDIAVGNIVGSNIFNILSVLGIGAVVAPAGIDVSREMASFAMPVMLAVAVACLPIFFAASAIRRWEGAIFLLYFAAYMTHMILNEIHDKRLATLQNAMIYYVIPLTVLALAVSVYTEFRARKLRRLREKMQD